ncbi:MAG: Mur ligase domain-containing protein [Kiritimatiellae bacterium]|nr:Mur ligase domain-containing protein [Kiritimatiellia bacterium]
MQETSNKPDTSATQTRIAGSASVHIVGIGGVGMSALAQALLDSGARVSGSDRLLDRGDATEVLRRLREQGVALYAQDGSGVHAGLARLVVSTAIEEDNPDLQAARRLDLPVMHRAAELARVAGGRRLIAVTGTSGKSTVTAMLGWLLAGAGLDPLVINGASVVGWDAGGRIGSVRHGRGAWAVIEADESDRSLMRFEPEHAIVTNISADHFDLDVTRQIFERFRTRVRGTIIEGEPAEADIEASAGWRGGFRLEGVDFAVPLPGRHNVVNAWQAVRMARLLGIDAAMLARALAVFPGVERRLQRIGECGGATVIDDYAHNPAKLAAAWTTIAQVFPRVTGLWRPHGYGPLRAMMDGLTESLAQVVRPRDKLLLLPVYDAGGTADRSVNSTALLAHLRARGVPAAAVNDIGAAEVTLRAAASPGTALLICGARDPDLPRLARRLAGHTTLPTQQAQP